MVSFEHVSKFILSDVTLHIPEGICVGIIGASGAGKTTLLRLACGLLAPEQGAVYTMLENPVEVLLRESKRRTAPGKRMGCLLERMPLFDAEQSLAQNLKELQIAYRMSEQEFLTEYLPLAERLAIREYEKEPVKALSFGQRRRAELVAVLLCRPKLLLLDEATIALDETAKTVLRELLRERVQEGMTVLLTSHSMKDVADTCDRIVLLEEGKIIYYGEEAELLRRYAPMDVMKLTCSGSVPDLEDLPIAKYEVQGEELRLTYNSNYVTASTILEVLQKQVSIKEISMEKQSLADVIFAVKNQKGGWKAELLHMEQ